MKLWFNLLCRDIEAQFAFYRDVFGLPEAEAARTPIYRAVETADFQFGFNDARAAYRLLGIAGREPVDAPPRATVAYPTLMLDSPAAVDAVVRRIPGHGGRVLKGPFATYYGQWQAVLADPEDNVFRVATASLPAGVTAPPRPGD
jgi:predicted enzyme related to lactoylglutathione lyase